jgi:hypothetical protein
LTGVYIDCILLDIANKASFEPSNKSTELDPVVHSKVSAQPTKLCHLTSLT